ncbi:MAG: hypothetical protein M0030_16810 [Actinomycetota bacterium]|nr:hypothetical protein [Actinomycetota bacterium]
MTQTVPAMTGPPGVPEHPPGVPEHPSGVPEHPPERDSGPPEPALGTWDQVAEFIGSAYRVERELPGQGLVFWVTLASGARQFILARSFPARGGVEHVTLRAVLGHVRQVDLTAAARWASPLLGGVTCDDDLVSLRDSRCLSTLTASHLRSVIGQMAEVLDGYVTTVAARRSRSHGRGRRARKSSGSDRSDGARP